jgi:hypothetical protein
MSLPDCVRPVQRGETHGSPTNPLLLVGLGESAARGLPAGKAGLRPERCASLSRDHETWSWLS